MIIAWKRKDGTSKLQVLIVLMWHHYEFEMEPQFIEDSRVL
jgi:hypothetical protein